MLAITLIAVAVIFGLLLAARLGGAHRGELMARWPALLLAIAAIFALLRGGVSAAFILLGLAMAAWRLWPALAASRQRTTDASQSSSADAEARTVLGVGPKATEADIRRAYRAKMVRAHPDRGGSNVEAARLTAARDRLLRKN